ncbi:RNA polymerase sigma factor [Novosphingobium sp.]|uniref:RNA polymerase sigma factor n=1 Tax=Novosphingobium sp. TaxID=1874826 RepID=UPI0038BCC064
MMFHGDIQRHADVIGEGGFARDASLPPPANAPLDTCDDTALMALVAGGDADAFGVLVDRHAGALYRVAMRMLADTHEAEDVVQEAFARAWQQAPRWKPSGAGLVGWLHRVTMNLCFDRKRRFRVVLAPELPEQIDEAPLADAGIIASQARAAVAGALADLPERYRAALVLCYYEGFSNALAAEVMGLNIKAMESLLFRARRQLRELLEARDVRCRDLVPESCAA